MAKVRISALRARVATYISKLRREHATSCYNGNCQISRREVDAIIHIDASEIEKMDGNKGKEGRWGLPVFPVGGGTG